METLIAGHRVQKGGPVSEAVVVQDSETGDVTIDLAAFDEQYNDRDESQRDALIARSFITLPASLMNALMSAWANKYPEGAPEEGWTDWEGSQDSNLAAAGFVNDITKR